MYISSPSTKKNRRAISLVEKTSLRQYRYSKNGTYKEMQAWFNTAYGHTLSRSTINDILSDRYASLDTSAPGQDLEDQGVRRRQAKWKDLENALSEWQQRQKTGGGVVSDAELRRVAAELWTKLPMYAEDEMPKWSNGWLNRYKRRHSLKQYCQHYRAGSSEAPADTDEVDCRSSLSVSKSSEPETSYITSVEYGAKIFAPFTNDSFDDKYHTLPFEYDPTTSSFPVMDCPQIVQPTTRRVNAPVPYEVLKHLGTFTDIQSVVGQYFRTIHVWMPILSKKELNRHLILSQTEPRADLALLCLCMKLITDTPATSGSCDMRTSLYATAKRAWTSIVAAGEFSTNVLQAGALLAMYEFGHAIYPAAYQSAATCARLGIALGGANGCNGSALPAAHSWAEREERYRVWWICLLLDRYMSLGIRGRPLATPDPGADHHVPVDDLVWEEGAPEPLQTTLSSLQSDRPIGVFAQEAHACNLLGRVIRHKINPVQDPEFAMEEAVQLDRTLSALVALLMKERVENTGKFYCGAIAMCHSALFTLHKPDDPESGIVPMRAFESQHTASKIKRAADRVLDLSKELLTGFATLDLEATAPLLPDASYRSARVYLELAQTSKDERFLQAYEVCKESLRMFDKRWRIAGCYIRMLEQSEKKLIVARASLLWARSVSVENWLSRN